MCLTFVACVDAGSVSGPANRDGRGDEIAAYSDDGARTVHEVHSGVMMPVCLASYYRYLDYISRETKTTRQAWLTGGVRHHLCIQDTAK